MTDIGSYSDDRIDTALGALGYFPDDQATRAQFVVLVRALDVYAERNKKYNDNFKRMGWRGLLIRIRERAERLWDAHWDWEGGEAPDPDDAIDLINFAAFLVRSYEGETTRDGEWWR